MREVTVVYNPTIAGEQYKLPERTSPTSVGCYLTCPEQYRLRYVKRHPRRGAGNLHQGKAIHEGIAYDLTEKMQVDQLAPLPDVLDLCGDTFETLIEEDGGPTEVEWDGGKLLTGGDALKAKGEKKDETLGLQELHHKYKAEELKPVRVEEEITTEIEGVPFLGYVDLREPGEIVDHKIAKTSRIWPHWGLQMALYRLVTNLPSRWDLVVKTKSPYVEGKGRTSHSTSDAQRTTAIFLTAVAGIMRDMVSPGPEEHWTPSGAHNDKCGFCSFRDRCKFAVLR